jgi:L-alanine-DL-glutamate epimerase-like enolase superfamily enzyme
VLKVKLGVNDATDRMMVNTIRKVTDKPMYVDVNQGWKDKHYALDMIHWLKEQNITMVEQPMNKLWLDETAWVTERSPLPVIADESCQRLTDVQKLKGAFHGINIKLMKCTGMREAREMISLAKALKLRLMIGCMTETSCAISAAAQLAPETEWADLDGNLLISNDLYSGMKIVDGKITLNDKPGIGIVKI